MLNFGKTKVKNENNQIITPPENVAPHNADKFLTPPGVLMLLMTCSLCINKHKDLIQFVSPQNLH